MNNDILVTSNTLREVNAVLTSVIHSSITAGRCYLRISPVHGFIEASQNAAEASSMEEISNWVHQISINIFPISDRAEVLKLRENYSKFVKQQMCERLGRRPRSRVPSRQTVTALPGQLKSCLKRTETIPRAARTARVYAKYAIFGERTGNQIEDTYENIDKALSIYGRGIPKTRKLYTFTNHGIKEKPVEKEIYSSLNYAKYDKQRQTAKANLEARFNRFEALSDADELTDADIVAAFCCELQKNFPASNPQSKRAVEVDRAAVKLVVHAFQDVLGRLTDFVEDAEDEPDADAIVDQFLEDFDTEINAQNIVVVEGMDRDTFRDCMGKLLSGGPDKAPPDIDGFLPDVKKLLVQYKTREWGEGQTRDLTYYVINTARAKKMEKALELIVGSQAFSDLMANYFERCIQARHG